MDEQQTHSGEMDLPEEIGMADIAPSVPKAIHDETVPRKEDARWYTIHT